NSSRSMGTLRCIAAAIFSLPCSILCRLSPSTAVRNARQADASCQVSRDRAVLPRHDPAFRAFREAPRQIGASVKGKGATQGDEDDFCRTGEHIAQPANAKRQTVNALLSRLHPPPRPTRELALKSLLSESSISSGSFQCRSRAKSAVGE